MREAKRYEIVRTQLVREKTALYANRFVKSPDDAANLARAVIGDSDREQFVVMMLNTKNELNAIHVVSIGSLNTSIVHPRETFKAAVVSSASGVVFAHNHPSNDISPSSEDVETTKRLVEAGNILGIKVLDHVIISQDRYYSFKEAGLL